VSVDPPPTRKGYARRVLDGIDWVAALLVILIMAGMVVVVATQVFLRYVLNLSLDWAEEISRLLFVWSIFIAIPLGIKRGAHLSVVLLTERLPHDVRSRLFRTMNGLAMVLMAVVAWQAGVLMRDQWDEPMSTLDISVGLFMMPLVIGAVHSLLHLLLDTIDGVPAKAPPRAE
jgi:TRAP-type C4-dicarboxylate transport system permease small subunit